MSEHEGLKLTQHRCVGLQGLSLTFHRAFDMARDCRCAAMALPARQLCSALCRAQVHLHSVHASTFGTASGAGSGLTRSARGPQRSPGGAHRLRRAAGPDVGRRPHRAAGSQDSILIWPPVAHVCPGLPAQRWHLTCVGVHTAASGAPERLSPPSQNPLVLHLA